jgi:hypothetical protein
MSFNLSYKDIIILLVMMMMKTVMDVKDGRKCLVQINKLHHTPLPLREVSRE